MDLSKLEAESLSYNDIEYMLDGKVNVVTYPELGDYETLDDLLGPYGRCVLLYMTGENFGHWTCVIKVNDDLVEVYDSYGIKPDRELNFIPNHLKESKRQDYAYLSQLLDDSPYQLSYNQHKMQKFAKGISTCGRWCVARCFYQHWPLEKFKKRFVNNEFNIDPDKYVTILSELLKQLKE